MFDDTIAALKQFQGGSTIVLWVQACRRRSPSSRPCHGVARAEPASDGVFRVTFADDADPTDELVRRAVERGWGLYQLTPAQTSLEDVFVSFTRREEQA